MIELLHRPTCSKCRGAVALLAERGVPFTIRDYVADPLSEAELRDVLAKLAVPVADLLRKGDPLYGELGLTGSEPDDVLVAHLLEHPALLNRPIAIRGDRALLARPPERVLELL